MGLEVVEETLEGELNAMDREVNNYRVREGLLERSVSKVKGFGRAVKDEVTSKEYWVDTLTGTSFWAPMMTVNEKIFQGWLYDDPSSWDEIGAARLTGFGIALLVSRRLTRFRDYWKEKVFKVNKDSSKIRDVAADLSLALTLIPGIYTTSLLLAGESWSEVGQMVPTGSAIQVGVAMVYVRYLNASRRFFGTTPDYLLNENGKV